MRYRRFVFAIWLLAGFWAIAIILAQQAGFLINTTASMPQGLWQVKPLLTPMHRNRIVSICPTDTTLFQLAQKRGYIPLGKCSGGYAPLLKTIAAVPGDLVTVSEKGIQVNGHLLVRSKPQVLDEAGRSMPVLKLGHYRVVPGSVWLLSSYNPHSFDSRYFGPLPSTNIQGLAHPVWVGSHP